MSDCKVCGLPPCTCRCGLATWEGVLLHLKAAQLHAERINEVKAKWRNNGHVFGRSSLRVSLSVMVQAKQAKL